jgi:hypothetical protein
MGETKKESLLKKWNIKNILIGKINK